MRKDNFPIFHQKIKGVCDTPLPIFDKIDSASSMRNDNHIIKLGRGKKLFFGIAEEQFFTTTQPQFFCHSERSEESISNLSLTLQFISDIRQRR
ncbi:hypothetical protein CHU00_02345 [Sphingobacterium cellulitidis]|nr:hypothetical protein CHU00_02345 [Sphingobacterium cellulitidis]